MTVPTSTPYKAQQEYHLALPHLLRHRRHLAVVKPVTDAQEKRRSSRPAAPSPMTAPTSIFRGDGKTDFWRYPIASGTSGSWESLAPRRTGQRRRRAGLRRPAASTPSAAPASTTFWRYDIASNSWDTSLAPFQCFRWKQIKCEMGRRLVVFGVPGRYDRQAGAYPTLVSCKPTAVGDCPVASHDRDDRGPITAPQLLIM